MAGYSRRDIDRMAVLHDLWTSEARFHDNKMKLVNCYLECYHNTTELVGRERLAKVLFHTAIYCMHFSNENHVHTYNMMLVLNPWAVHLLGENNTLGVL